MGSYKGPIHWAPAITNNLILNFEFSYFELIKGVPLSSPLGDTERGPLIQSCAYSHSIVEGGFEEMS